MSQSGRYSVGSGAAPVETLTGNTGGAVPPTGGNINVVGDTTTITVAGNPATSTLTISTTGSISNSFPADSGTATPSGGVLNIFSGGQGRATPDTITVASGNTVRVDLRNSITLGDLSNITGSNAIALNTGDITLSAGNVNIPETLSSIIGGITSRNLRFIHTYGAQNTFVGELSGNFTLTGAGNSGFGESVFAVLTNGSSNTALGTSALSNLTTGSSNQVVGNQAGLNITTGSSNTVLGQSALTALTTGSSNIAIGNQAGAAHTLNDSSNIAIGHPGTAGVSNRIRIGTPGTHTTCFITGIDGVNVGSVATVVTENGNQLGTATMTAGTGITVTPGANAITIATSGTSTLTYTNVNTTPYVVLSTDQFLGVDCSGAPITVQLPNTTTTGRVFTIKDRTGSANTNNITVTTVGGAVNIDGATTYVMNTQYAAISVLFDGTTYQIW